MPYREFCGSIPASDRKNRIAGDDVGLLGRHWLSTPVGGDHQHLEDVY